MADIPLTTTKFQEDNTSGSFGRRSKLYLSSRLQGDKAVLDKVYFSAPFKVMEPFYREPDDMEVILLSASPGIMEGDFQEQHIHVGKGTKLKLSSQSFEKIHKMKNGCATRRIRICQEKNSLIYYAPQPAIPFKESAFENVIDVELEDTTSRFILQEILSCGRSACGERFDYRYYHSMVQVRRGGRLIYRDNTRYDPHTLYMEETGMYEGYSHLASLLLCGFALGNEWVEKVRDILKMAEQAEGGVSVLASGDVVVRILGNQAQQLQELCKLVTGA